MQVTALFPLVRGTFAAVAILPASSSTLSATEQYQRETRPFSGRDIFVRRGFGLAGRYLRQVPGARSTGGCYATAYAFT